MLTDKILRTFTSFQLGKVSICRLLFPVRDLAVVFVSCHFIYLHIKKTVLMLFLPETCS